MSCVTACNKGKLSEDVQSIMNKRIQLPSELKKKNSFAIINYVDSAGCTSCKLRVENWQKFLDNTIESNMLVDVIFITHPKVFTDVSDIVSDHCRDKITVICDTNEQWRVQNDLPTNEMLHTFLIDKKNKAVIIGNPSQNERIAKMMLDYIKTNR